MDLIQDWQQRKKGREKSHRKLIHRLKREKGKSLNLKAGEIHDSVFSELSCLDCANCCSSIPPIVNRTDASRIARHLGMQPGAFRKAYLVEDEDGDTVMNATPCPFLENDNRCRIYEFRPRACREYPHTDRQEFSHRIHLHAANAQFCPAAFHILERISAIK